jgi:hypothetical protein
MAALSNQVKETVERMAEAIKGFAKREGYKDVAPKPRKPAKDSDLEKYEKYLGQKLPPSYREFLKLHDGYDWLAFPGHMLSIKDVMPGGEWHNNIKEWKQMFADYGRGEVVSGIVFAYLEEPNDYCYFDTEKPAKKKELPVVKFTANDPEEFPNLLAYFENIIEFCSTDFPTKAEMDAAMKEGKPLMKKGRKNG